MRSYGLRFCVTVRPIVLNLALELGSRLLGQFDTLQKKKKFKTLEFNVAAKLNTFKS